MRLARGFFWLSMLLMLLGFVEPAMSEITVGALAELSGSGASNGRACRLGYEAADAYYSKSLANAKKLKIVYGDHRGESKTAVLEFQKLTHDDGAVAVISNRGHIGMALDPISKHDRIPLLGIMGHADFVKENPYGFRFWPSPNLEGRLLAETVATLRLSRTAVIALHDDYILSMVDQFKKTFTEGGGAIVYFDTIDKDITDFQSIITRVRASNPDVIFVNGDVSQLGTLVRKIRDQGLKQQIVSNFWIQYGDVIKSAGADKIEGAIYVGVDLRKAKFLEALRLINSDQEPSMVTYACFSAVAAIYNVLNRPDPPSEREGLFRALAAMKTIELPDEEVKIIGREVQYKLVPMIIRNGRSEGRSEILGSKHST